MTVRFSLTYDMATKHVSCILVCLLSASLAFPQQAHTLSGKVLDAQSGRPLSSISVYLDNTSIGTSTNDNGEFSLGHIPPAKYKLVVSGISFKTFSRIIDTRDSIGPMIIQLTRKADLLTRAEVRAPDPNGWAKWGQLFTNVFVGTSPHAGKCRILNHEVIKFRLNDDNTLGVYAEKPIQLYNAALGYDITYDLEDFTYDFYSGVVEYTGHVFFKDLTLARLTKAATWRQNRAEVYKGSILHFMRSLYRNTLQPEGFELHSLAKLVNRDKQRAKLLFAKSATILDTVSRELADSNGSPGYKYVILDSTAYYKLALRQPDSVISHRLVPPDSVAFAEDSTLAGFYSPDSLEVSYKLKEVPAAYKRLSPAARRQKYPVSQLVFINKRPVYVLSNGFFYKGNELKITGYWGWAETLGTLLPYDYVLGQ